MSGVSFNFIPYVDVEIPEEGRGDTTPQTASGIAREKQTAQRVKP